MHNFMSTSTGGGPKTSADSSDSSWNCKHYCHRGCSSCPPDSGDNLGGIGGIGIAPPGIVIGPPGGGGGGDGGDGDSNTKTDDSSTSTSSSSSSSSESAAFTVFAMGTTYFADHLPTTDALAALEAFASSDAALMQSLYGSEISFAETATNTLATVSATATATTASSTGFAYTYTEVVGCPTEILVDLVGNTYASTVGVSPTTISTAYIYTSTQSGGATVGCVSDIVLYEANESPQTQCLECVTIGGGGGTATLTISPGTISAAPTTTSKKTTSTSSASSTTTTVPAACKGGSWASCDEFYYHLCMTGCENLDGTGAARGQCQSGCGLQAQKMCDEYCDS